ncbi:hypothetical protein KSY51_13025 [Erysipelatoclostridium ramosum]|nr:hypothetical protein [Thomasclavelia ramosa]MBV4108960.1 hypothetical protein [Thomasclavelia ramosa]
MKIILIMQYLYFLKLYFETKKEDNTIQISFGLLSLFEFFCILGLNIAFVCSIILEAHSIYFFLIGTIINIYTYFMLNRVIIVGERKILLKGKIVDLKRIKKVEARFYSVIFNSRDGKLSVTYPIINHQILYENIIEKVNKF